MTDVREQLAQYAPIVVGDVEPVSAGEVMARRRRAPVVLIAAAALAVAAMVVTLAVRRADNQPGVTTNTSGPAARMPAQIVAAIDNRVVLLSSKDGTVVRVVASAPSNVASVAASPDGSTIYFTQESPSAGCPNGAEYPVIMRVTSEEAPQSLGVRGLALELSPNGYWLAYQAGNGCEGGDLGVLDTRTGIERRPLRADPAAGFGYLKPASWSANSRTLLFSHHADDQGPRYSVIRAALSDPTPRAVPHSTGWNAAGFVGSGEDIVAATRVDNTLLVQTVSARWGRVRERAFDLRGMSVGEGFDVLGTHVVFDTLEPVRDGSAVTFRPAGIWRWDGSGPPVRLAIQPAGQVRALAWVSGPGKWVNTEPTHVRVLDEGRCFGGQGLEPVPCSDTHVREEYATFTVNSPLVLSQPPPGGMLCATLFELYTGVAYDEQDRYTVLNATGGNRDGTSDVTCSLQRPLGPSNPTSGSARRTDVRDVKVFDRGVCSDGSLTVPCTDPHTSERFATFTYLWSKATGAGSGFDRQMCEQLYERFTGARYDIRRAGLAAGSSLGPYGVAIARCEITSPSPPVAGSAWPNG